MTEAFICDAVRTPIGRYGGSLAAVRPDDLAALTLATLVDRNPGVDWAATDDVILGCANQAGEDNRNVARMAVLLSGLPVEVSASTINRLCGSGMEAVGLAARAIRAGEAELVVAGGVESMSRAPKVMPKATAAFDRNSEIYDSTIGWRFVNPLLAERFGRDEMPATAENVAAEFGISRHDQDAFAVRSQQRAGNAIASGRLGDEIVAVEVAQRRGDPVKVDTDEHPRPDTSAEALARLRPLFEGGTVTAGNASGINDGAAAVVVASETAAERHRLEPKARIVGMATAGVPPRIMGMGPVPATTKLLDRVGLGVGDIDVIELNEAFAAQALACLRQLGL
ncbi:MAG: acetyl-CoA C-acyltransferase, partial [Acidimicrobiia bacterium]|nr:acetyl-CoA C-acyltransferase [Acidimicrobiia bacterium]